MEMGHVVRSLEDDHCLCSAEGYVEHFPDVRRSATSHGYCF